MHTASEAYQVLTYKIEKQLLSIIKNLVWNTIAVNIKGVMSIHSGASIRATANIILLSRPEVTATVQRELLLNVTKVLISSGQFTLFNASHTSSFTYLKGKKLDT